MSSAPLGGSGRTPENPTAPHPGPARLSSSETEPRFEQSHSWRPVGYPSMRTDLGVHENAREGTGEPVSNRTFLGAADGARTHLGFGGPPFPSTVLVSTSQPAHTIASVSPTPGYRVVRRSPSSSRGTSSSRLKTGISVDVRCCRPGGPSLGRRRHSALLGDDAVGEVAVGAVGLRKLPKDTGRETRGGDGAAEGMGIEGGT